MSEKLCTLRTKGGGGGTTYTETVLWTNPSPSSNFATQTVTLSDDINNYDYLKVSYVNYVSGAGTNDPFSVLISVSDFKTSLSGNSTRHNMFTFGGIYAPSNTSWTRIMFYDTDTTAKFGACTQIGGSQSTDNNAIPLQIVGIKQHGTIKPQTPDLSTPPNVLESYTNVSQNTVKNIAVTQTPKFIVLEFCYYINSSGCMLLVLNVENNTCYRYGYWGSAWHIESYSAWDTYITSISSSNVSVKQVYSSSAQNIAVGIYY